MFRTAPALLAAAALALPLAACGSDEATTPATGGASDELANLVVTVDADGDGGESAKELQVSCKAPTDSDVCGEAAGLSAADLAEKSGDVACTQIFGGPETATIRGTLRGEQVEARYARSDGCEINRWDRVKPLLDHVK
jgi:hypothetical protein